MFRLIKSPFQSFANLTFRLSSSFSFPKHDILSMPALSPTMKEGKILKWLINVGDKVQPGDAIAQIETDKATMSFQVQEKGYIAKLLSSDELIPIGNPVAVLTKTSDQAQSFSNFSFNETAPSGPSSQSAKANEKVKKQQSSKQSLKEYPPHTFLQMPAVSPTMTEGKILEWKIHPGDSFNVGDALFSIETDKAVVDYEATEKGILAKVIADNNQALPIGKNVAVVVKKKESISSFSDFSDAPSQSKTVQSTSTSSAQSSAPTKAFEQNRTSNNSERVFASPLARSFAKEKGIDLSVVQGSGPNNRIIKQDIENIKVGQKREDKAEKFKEEEVAAKQEEVPQKKESKKIVADGVNPFEVVALTSMRKTIANRLSESKQTIPHYYITLSIEMGSVMSLRTDLNKNQKQNGVKISVNDIIIKAMALALRDYPDVNVQWHGNSIHRFKYADISVAVAIEGGLITPIIRRADTLGFLEISKRTKDLAKRAREGKLDPSEFTGGTSTISNLGMYGINTVSSIINPPQATILGVGATVKKVVPSEGPEPYRTADVMQIIASCDHRAVDGALAAQWMTRIKHYIENPSHMLL